MKCSRIRKKISSYSDGEMPECEMHLISEHLQQCKECRAELAALSAVHDALNAIEGMEVPPFFMTRLRQSIREESRPASIRQRIRGLVFTAATAFALVASLFLGNQAGKNLYRSITQSPTPAVVETNNVFSLDSFEEFPDGSLSDIYDELVAGGYSG